MYTGAPNGNAVVDADGAAKRAEGNAEHDAAQAKGYAGAEFVLMCSIWVIMAFQTPALPLSVV